MIKHIVYLSFLVSNNVYSIHLKYNDEPFLSSNTQRSWDCFLSSPSMQQYNFFSTNISKLPFINSALIHPKWLLSTKHLINHFSDINPKNYFEGIPIGEKGEKIFLDNSTNPFVEHPTLNLSLIKIKPTHILPVERSRNPQDALNPNIPKLFFSRTVHHGIPSINPYEMIPTSEIQACILCKMTNQGFGGFVCIEADFRHYSNHLRYRFQNNCNIIMRTYKGDEGNPIFAWITPNNDPIKLTDFEDPYKHARVIGIANTMYGEYFIATDITRPDINEWIDQVILSDGLK